jgi:hypothetical protein
MSGTRTIPHSLQAALDLAAAGVRIFPCYNAPGTKKDKAPVGHLCPNGFEDATTNLEQVRRWFADGTALIGIPTGDINGFDVLDIDTKKGGDVWLRANSKNLPATRTYRTQSSGLHLAFQANSVLRNSAGNIAPGVDIRSNGGYVVGWFAHNYKVELDAKPAAWPDWLLVEAMRGHAGGNGEPTDIARRCPPSAAATVALLTRLPNGPDVPRETYEKVMAGAAGCIAALRETGDLTTADEAAIGDAAVAWAEIYVGEIATDERQKWEDDWSKNAGNLAGWQSLTRVARDLIDGYADEIAAARLAEAQEEFGALPPLPEEPPPAFSQSLVDRLSVPALMALTIPPTTRYLGDLVTTASRVFMIGATGLGKSQIAHAMAAGIASGSGFLHWQCDRPARVLVIDGEMSTRLVKARIADMVRRHPAPIPDGNLTVFIMDRAAEFTADLGKAAPLNTPAGLAFARKLITAVKPEVVIFDNLMSLVTGDQTTEIPWSETEPLRTWLVPKGIAQVWLDHTGNARERQYGSSTKRWAVDSVGIMTDDGATKSPVEGRISFKLSFSAPHGKSRERCKENWQDFADYTITLDNDVWTSARTAKEPAKEDFTAKGKQPDLKPGHVKWHDALQTTLAASGKPTATTDEWYATANRMRNPLILISHSGRS